LGRKRQEGNRGATTGVPKALPASLRAATTPVLRGSRIPLRWQTPVRLYLIVNELLE